MRETDRDHALLEWLTELRIADVDAIRWALAGLAGRADPVSQRKAQWWIARCRDAGLIEVGRPTFRDGSVCWVSHQVSGKAAPDLHRQTTRHEVAVAAASARYLARSFEWQRDRRPVVPKVDHQADGVAAKGGERVLVEVELTAKTGARYAQIFRNHLARNRHEDVTAVTYFCTPSAAAAVRRHIDPRADRFGFVRVVDVFDQRGRWRADAADVWPSIDDVARPLAMPEAPAANDAGSLWGAEQ